MKSLKRFFCQIVILFIFGCSFLSAFDNGFFIGVEPVYSLQNGTLYEYVIAYDNVSKQNVTMSELDWSISNISYLGGRVKTGWNFISLTAEYSKGFSKASGTMEDYDWLNYNTKMAPYSYIDPSICTTKSISENQMNKADNFEISLKLDINPFFDLLISPFIGFNYSSIDFSGRNGYGWYGQVPFSTDGKACSYDSPEAKFFDKLFGIDYYRQTYEVFLGFSLGYILFDRVSFGGTIGLSPYVNVQSLDFHHSDEEGKNGNYYHDVMTGYFNKFRFGAYVECMIIKGLSADVSFDYSLQNFTPGVTYQSKTGKFKKSDKAITTAACSGKYWFLKAGVKYTF